MQVFHDTEDIKQEKVITLICEKFPDDQNILGSLCLRGENFKERIRSVMSREI